MLTKPAAELYEADWAVLGVVSEEPTHGFAVAQLLAPDAALGRVWRVARPAVYASLKKLGRADLVAAHSVESGAGGPRKTILSATDVGSALMLNWLIEPVSHVRDVRSLLLLKLALLHRRQLDPLPLLAAQRQVLVPRMASLTRQRRDATGFEATLLDCRLASCSAALTFLEVTTRGALVRS